MRNITMTFQKRISGLYSFYIREKFVSQREYIYMTFPLRFNVTKYNDHHTKYNDDISKTY